MRPIKYQLIWQGAIYESISIEDIIMGHWEVDGVMYKDFEDNEKGQQVSTTRKDYIFFSEDENDFGVWRQWTGLHDKNGKKMYFDDLVKKNGDDRIYRIVHDVMGGAYPHHDDIYNSFGPKCSIDFYPVTGGTNICTEWEVIGNIYENPELLNQ